MDPFSVYVPHNATPAIGPGEQKAWLVCSAAHGIVSGSVRCPYDEGDMRNLGAAHSGYHLSASLNNTRMFSLGADHESCDILEEYDWSVPISC